MARLATRLCAADRPRRMASRSLWRGYPQSLVPLAAGSQAGPRARTPLGC